MIGNKRLLSNVLPSSLDSVTFRDDAKESVLGPGSLNIPSFPKLRDVFLIDGLKANLINISQLCDQEQYIKFTKDKCIVVYQDQHKKMEGQWSLDNS